MGIDLNNDDLAELDDLLARTPEPLEPQDAVMLDGYLAGVALQPRMVAKEAWLAFVFDRDEGRALDAHAEPRWLARCRALIERRFEVMTTGIAEERWFDPVVLDIDQLPPTSEYDAKDTARDDVVTQTLGAWVSGFSLALEHFPELTQRGLDDDVVASGVNLVLRHAMTADEAMASGLTPLATGKDNETIDASERVQRAVDDLVTAVVALWHHTERDRMHVEPVVRGGTKLGRNDPCHCGSGRKFKHCHANA